MAKVDLHVHTCASDGKFSPEQVIQKAAELGLSVIAITDHDTINGINSALKEANKFPALTIIPGVEISTQSYDGEIHILGYFIDLKNPKFTNTLENLRNSRIARAKEMVIRLNKLGIQISWQQIEEMTQGRTIGRPHIALAMIERGYINSFKEAFDKYIGRDRPGYVEHVKLSPIEAVSLINSCNGFAVLAHPLTIQNTQAMIDRLKPAGLVGIEAYYKDYSEMERSNLVSIARKNNLIPTGGSDYHGLDDSTEIMIGNANVPIESAERLIFLTQQQVTLVQGQ